MKKFFVMILVFCMAIGLAGCSGMSTKIPIAEKEKMVVGVSIVPQSTFVKSVGGDGVDVVTMIPPGNSPANYQPSPKQMQLLSEASVYFSIGVPAEAFILPKIKQYTKDIKIVELQHEVEKQHPCIYYDSDHDNEHQHGDADPHIWLSPRRVVVIINEIEAMLSKIDPENKSIYKRNAKDYIESLEQLDTDIQNMVKGLESKSFMVYHPVFSYFAKDYGLEMILIEQEGKEATIKDLQHIIDLAKQNNIQTIFYQAEINSKQSRLIAAEIGATTVMVQPLASDYIENMRRLIEVFRSLDSDK